MNPAVMHKQLQRCLETYYKEVLKILGASGRPDASVYKHKFNKVLEDAEAQLEQGDPGDGDGASAMPSSVDGAGAEDAGPLRRLRQQQRPLHPRERERSRGKMRINLLLLETGVKLGLK